MQLNSDNPWIVQPFEVYEELRIEDIKEKHLKIKRPVLSWPFKFKLFSNN